METTPQAPLPIERGELSSYERIQVNWVALETDAETGGSPILSYQLDWDNGLDQNVWADLVGYSSTFTGTTYTVESVAPGVSYTFRVRAQNTHGWSDWSEPYTTILSASAPA